MIYYNHSKGKGHTRVCMVIIMTQEQINATAKNIVSICGDYTGKWVRFGSKQCWVSECIKNRYFLIKSYNSIVAVIDDQNGDLFELGKYSVTTSKQVTQLYNLCDWDSYHKFGYSELTGRYLVK